jgi:MerR family copper efflux transcriptional regulator
MKPLTIGEVASRAGIGVETIRFYERRGLLSEPARNPSGYRQYQEEDIARLFFIKRAKGLGFTLKEVKELLSLRLDPVAACAEVQRRAEAKIGDIEAKLKSLERMKKALVKLVATCQGHGETSNCPILESLDGG